MGTIDRKQQNKIINFFEDEISCKEFAKKMRRLIYIAIDFNLYDDGSRSKDLSEIYYWATHFSEILDPTGVFEDD